MSAEIVVTLAENDTVIEQRVVGRMTLDDFSILIARTAELVKRLRDPLHVRILVDARKMGRSTPALRRASLSVLAKPDFYRMALWGGTTEERITMRFLATVAGRRMFGVFCTREEALIWLKE